MNSKRKGNSFEREVAKKLSFWACKEKNKIIFWRTPSSGLLATIQNQKNLTGDIVAYEPEFTWWNDYINIECKIGYNKMDYNDILIENKKNNLLKKFWEQTNVKQKIPILIIKKNRKILIGINKFLFNTLKINKNYVHYHFDNDDIYFFELDVFLNEVSIEKIKDIVYGKNFNKRIR